VIGYLAVLAVGYVLGSKAGRARYEQIAGTYRALTGNPATRSMIEAGRRKIAERVSPDPAVITVTEIEAGFQTEFEAGSISPQHERPV
jgi:hypothetical protein